MSSPYPVIAIVIAYLVFVLKLGPEYMKDKNPLNIKPAILVYNLFQTCFNFFMVQKMFTISGALSYLWNYGCHPMDPAVNPYYIYLAETAWFFFISKVLDLLDTVFFILRKKNSHVTFLHVYHHANMVMVTWAYLKYIKGEQGVVVGWINALVHTVMYAYYFLSALGPEIQKYLWWKRYITRMQMVQFVVIIVYMVWLLMAKCDMPHVFTYFLIFQGGTFLVLFANFYIQSYILKPKKAVKNATNGTTNGVASPVVQHQNGKKTE